MLKTRLLTGTPGIHNEAGSERAKMNLPDLLQKMLKYMLDTSDSDRGYSDITRDDQVLLLVNNLGGVSPLEMGGITNEVAGLLKSSYGIKPVRIFEGTYMTSLNGLGFSISLLKLVATGSSCTMLQLLDAPTEATGWTATIRTKTWQASHVDEIVIDRAREANAMPSTITCKFQSEP